MANVELFLPETEIFSLLSIPRSDIERLAVLPFRWLRYVMYTVCGARGELTTPDGSIVDYDKTAIPDGENKYHYIPSGKLSFGVSDCCSQCSTCADDLAFIDDQGLSDRNTILSVSESSSTMADLSGQSSNRRAFTQAVLRRDRPVCVVTQAHRRICDAAHIIPHSKGDEYIANVFRLRSRNGEVPPSSIDDVTNGVLLRKDLHAMLGYGEIAFIKTPNYELEPEHIKRFKRGGPRDHITLQFLKKPDNYDPITLEANCRLGPVPPDRAFTYGANIDALFQGEGRSLPSTTILDYFYGIAAYKYWHSGVSTAIVEHRQNYRAQLTPALTYGVTEYDSGAGEEEDSDNDENHSEYLPSLQEPSQEHKISRGDERRIGQVMDEANTTLMWYKGIKQREATECKEKDGKKEERDKVIEWRNHLDLEMS
ncbi:hypothetical protein F5148DRAFT_428034 [Russula earlei]|uniref:Uncharacterized protein n=1 Tax=Russula earlei TaxID=71964 RepID=A0ACC0TZ66_9AGAM|nr:hypothetical protein F5148DRAFT_428034 [Russula earlei]